MGSKTDLRKIWNNKSLVQRNWYP